MNRLAVGQMAPPFSLLNDRGEKISLKDLRGERVVVYFYPADDTPGCTTEACEFNSELTNFSQLGVRVLGISPDDASSHQRFRKKYQLTFDLLSDHDHEVMAAYGAYGEKMLYGKTVVGVIRSTFVISPEGRIEHTFYGVRTKGHAGRVLAALT